MRQAPSPAQRTTRRPMPTRAGDRHPGGDDEPAPEPHGAREQGRAGSVRLRRGPVSLLQQAGRAVRPVGQEACRPSPGRAPGDGPQRAFAGCVIFKAIHRRPPSTPAARASRSRVTSDPVSVTFARSARRRPISPVPVGARDPRLRAGCRPCRSPRRRPPSGSGWR